MVYLLVLYIIISFAYNLSSKYFLYLFWLSLKNYVNIGFVVIVSCSRR
nr:MAG TPA: hypothetical protein [Caudoviricetes sp.]